MTSRFTKLVGIIISAMLLFQLVILFRNMFYVERRGISLANGINKINRLFHQMESGYTSRDVSTTANHNTPNKRWLTIGIPTIQRRDVSYFFIMLDSILNETRDEQLGKIYIIVFLADFNKTEWKHDMEKQLKANYSKYFDTGTLHVIRAPDEYYSKFTASSTSIPSKFLYWRTKQNYDYSYIMEYSKDMSEYYMQMEDDVITAEGYLNSIEDYIKMQTDDTWICLEFSELGFIGKLYHSRDVESLGQMLKILSKTQPVDYTFQYYNSLTGQGKRLIRKPTLFQHIGYHSSLSDKIQRLKDNYFNLPSKKYSSDNPEAEFNTTLTVYSDFPPAMAYSNMSGYFWSSSSAKEGDVFTIMFKTPQLLDKVIVETGTTDHKSDVINVGVVEASTIIGDSKDPPFCKDYVVIGQFINGVANITDVNSKIGLFSAKCLQIRVTQDQIHWIIIREIAIWVRK